MRRARSGCGGFTLLEALAATAILGLFAITAVPLLREFGRLDGSERLQAQAYLKSLPATHALGPGRVQSVPGHPAWSLSCSDLLAGPEPAPAFGSLPPAAPPHGWSLLRIHDNGSGEVLAETLVTILDRGVQP